MLELTSFVCSVPPSILWGDDGNDNCKFGISKLDSKTASFLGNGNLRLSDHMNSRFDEESPCSWSQTSCKTWIPSPLLLEQWTEYTVQTVLDVTSQFLWLTLCTQRQFTGFPSLSNQNLSEVWNVLAFGTLNSKSKKFQILVSKVQHCISFGLTLAKQEISKLPTQKAWKTGRAFFMKVSNPSISSKAITEHSISLIACGMPQFITSFACNLGAKTFSKKQQIHGDYSIIESKDTLPMQDATLAEKWIGIHHLQKNHTFSKHFFILFSTPKKRKTQRNLGPDALAINEDFVRRSSPVNDDIRMKILGSQRGRSAGVGCLFLWSRLLSSDQPTELPTRTPMGKPHASEAAMFSEGCRAGWHQSKHQK